MVAVKDMAKKKRPAEPQPKAADGTSTTIRVSPDFARKIGELAKLKGVSAGQLLDDMLIARLREELIHELESRASGYRAEKDRPVEK